MPRTKVVLYCEEDGSCPFLEWIERLPVKAQAKCLLRVERLRELGHELRRPEADLLREGIYELRARLQGVHYRILYFFHGAIAAVVAHGIVKVGAVPPKEIGRAIERKKRFEANPGEASPRGEFEMTRKTETTTDAVEILHRRLFEGKPERLKILEEARANEEIARKIFGLRTKAGLTQTQLGKLVGTTASAICRLEDADYEGHSLAMLRRIAAALNQRVEIRFVPIRRSA
jgi:phage-related protein/DNA-binding XRE family transcriptional regulator